MRIISLGSMGKMGSLRLRVIGAPQQTLRLGFGFIYIEY